MFYQKDSARIELMTTLVALDSSNSMQFYPFGLLFFPHYCMNLCSSYHILMLSYNIGMVGMMGSAAITKKRGGYTNTKLHGIMTMTGMLLAGGGFYVIYQNKESMGKNHFTTLHSWGEFTWQLIQLILEKSLNQLLI